MLSLLFACHQRTHLLQKNTCVCNRSIVTKDLEEGGTNYLAREQFTAPRQTTSFHRPHLHQPVTILGTWIWGKQEKQWQSCMWANSWWKAESAATTGPGCTRCLNSSVSELLSALPVLMFNDVSDVFFCLNLSFFSRSYSSQTVMCTGAFAAFSLLHSTFTSTHRPPLRTPGQHHSHCWAGTLQLQVTLRNHGMCSEVFRGDKQLHSEQHCRVKCWNWPSIAA